MRNRVALALTVLLLCATSSSAQAPAPPTPAQISAQTPANAPALAFDVASVRPSAPLDMARIRTEMQAGRMPRFGPHVDNSQADYTYMSLKDLIANAYDVKPYQITGPDWIATARFDIVAKLPEGASKDDAPRMLQSLLKERFNLTAHLDTREHPVLALVVAKGGPKMKESPTAPAPLDESAPLKPGETNMDTPNGPARVTRNSDGSTTINMGAKGTFTQKMDFEDQIMRLEASSITMPGFADMLTNVMQMGGGAGRPVVDMTGLKGNYQVAVDISLAGLIAMARAQGADIPGPNPGGSGSANTSPVPTASQPTGGSTIYASVEKLGLKLEPRKANVEQLVVDRVDKTPTAN